MITFYHQIKISISFWWRQRLNLRSLIQSSEILTIELTKTHKNKVILVVHNMTEPSYYMEPTNIDLLKGQS